MEIRGDVQGQYGSNEVRVTVGSLHSLQATVGHLRACDKFEPLFLSESSLSGQNMSLRGWPLVANLSNVRPVSV